MGDDREVFGQMIELQIKVFNELTALREEYTDLQEVYSDMQDAYRVQCVMNTRLVEQMKHIKEFVLGNRYIAREDLMAMLGLDEEPKAEDDALSRETEELAG